MPHDMLRCHTPGFHPEIPKLGFGDDTSVRLIGDATWLHRLDACKLCKPLIH